MTKDFIRKANLIHKNTYDYSFANYINSATKIVILCKKHGIFKQSPNNHLRGHGCPYCGKNKKKNKKKTILN